jgi:DNA replication protein DnaC
MLVVEAGYRGYFTTADDMVRTLAHAIVDGTFAHKLKTYTAPTVSVIDDVGLLPIEAERGVAAFFHVVNTATRNATRPSSPPTAGCPTGAHLFGDAVVASAILDRLMHDAIVFNIKGPSWRRREHQAPATAASTPNPNRGGADRLTARGTLIPRRTFDDREPQLSVIGHSCLSTT